jgi:hypothetical protein
MPDRYTGFPPFKANQFQDLFKIELPRNQDPIDKIWTKTLNSFLFFSVASVICFGLNNMICDFLDRPPKRRLYIIVSRIKKYNQSRAVHEASVLGTQAQSMLSGSLKGELKG